MSAISPLLGDKRTQRGHHQIDVNDPSPTSWPNVAREQLAYANAAAIDGDA
jgi:hypothetical protein